MPSIDWESYLKPPELSVAAHRAKSAATFAGQKENIRKLCRLLHPRTVLCMGAGYLNDIPVGDLIADDADIYFAELIDGVTEQSFRHDLIGRTAERFACLVCKCSGDPQKYCKSYREEHRNFSFFARARPAADHCDNFRRAENDAVPLCANYVPGEFPRFFHADVTQGVAEHFAREVPAILQRAHKPQQAFRYAIQTSAQPHAEAPLPLADHSVDFITSSMVASQFDFEPYSYFIRNLFLQFGQQTVEQNLEAINAQVETLRDNLFLSQVEGHCREMLRLLKPGGRIYFSIETLHADRSSDPYFQPEASCKAMAVIGRHFYFDLQTLPEIMAPVRTAMVYGGESVIQSCLLVPKPAEPRAAKS